MDTLGTSCMLHCVCSVSLSDHCVLMRQQVVVLIRQQVVVLLHHQVVGQMQRQGSVLLPPVIS